MTKLTKTNAREAFIAKDYKEAFSLLFELGVSEFVSYGQKFISANKQRNLPKKENWFLFKLSSKVLWGEFLLDENVFRELFSSDEAEHFLKYYFNNKIYLFPDLGKKLAKEFPELFIRCVRVYQLFLNPKGMAFLTKEIELTKKYQPDQKTWEIINDNEKKLWDKVENALLDIKSFSVPEILSCLVVWLENSRAKRNSIQDMHHLAGVYSYYMQLVLREVSQPILEFDDVKFAQIFLKAFREKSNERIFTLLDAIDIWYQYYTSIVSPYSFDLNFKPIIENESVYLYEPPLANYNYKLADIRYNYNNLRYYGIASIFIAKQENKNNNLIQGGINSELKDKNRELAIQQTQTRFMLDDLGITHLYLKDKEISIDKIIKPLRGYAGNRQFRYEEPLKEKLQKTNNWADAFIHVIKEAFKQDITNLPYPYIYLSIEHYQDLNKQASDKMTLQDTEDIIDLFSYTINCGKKFNRFNNDYHVLLKPFVKLNNHIFSPLAFFANNDWFYSAAQSGLLRNKFKTRAKERLETEYMEKSLGAFLKECNKSWSVIVTNQNLANEIKGDVDIIVEDNNHTLFIQLKRPYFRLDPKSAYFESLHDVDAAAQLNNAEESMLSSSSNLKIKNKPAKWIVSSSYEGIGREISACRKINFFDLLSAIRSHKFDSVFNLIEYIEKDTELKDFRKGSFYSAVSQQKQIVDALFNPLNYREPQRSKLLLETSNSMLVKENRTIFNRGLELHKQGENKAAIKVFQNYIERVPSDFEAYGAIANVYADNKDYNNAFKNFNKAMELSDFESEIVRNYILALAESGNVKQSVQLFKSLLEKYPLMDFNDVANAIKKYNKIQPQRVIFPN